MMFTFNVYAVDSNKKSKTPDYRVCAPVFVQIDYSYLRAGEWIGKEVRERIKVNLAKINNHPNDVERSWGLANCEI